MKTSEVKYPFYMKSEIVKDGFGEGRHYRSCESWQGNPCTCHTINPTIEPPKNKHAQALGKLGGRKPGFTGKPLDPAKARAMVASRWAKYRAQKEKTI